MNATTFTDDSPFTFDHTNEDNFRRHVRKPNNAESLRPEFKGSGFVLPKSAPHKGPDKGGMIADPRFDPQWMAKLVRGYSRLVAKARINSLYGKLATR